MNDVQPVCCMVQSSPTGGEIVLGSSPGSSFEHELLRFLHVRLLAGPIHPALLRACCTTDTPVCEEVWERRRELWRTTGGGGAGRPRARPPVVSLVNQSHEHARARMRNLGQSLIRRTCALPLVQAGTGTRTGSTT